MTRRVMDLSDDATSGRAAGAAEQGATASGAEQADETAKDDQTVLRIADLPRDVGWLMVSIGVLGVVLPGIIGTPFLVAGIAVLTPGGPRLLTRWIGPKPKGFVHKGLKQIGRWLDDLERRYPRPPSASS
jgi:hypothetical protein